MEDDGGSVCYSCGRKIAGATYQRGTGCSMCFGADPGQISAEENAERVERTRKLRAKHQAAADALHRKAVARIARNPAKWGQTAAGVAKLKPLPMAEED